MIPAAVPAVGGPTAAAEELRRYADGLRRYAERIEAATATTAHVNGSLAVAWADASGREWADRLQLVVRELARQADAARELARSVERTVTDLLDGLGDLLGRSIPTGGADHGARPAPPRIDVGLTPDPAAPDGPLGGGPDGVRLGGLDGSRVGPRRGVVVPTLPDPGG